jgi:hypothetical protein
MQKNMGEMKIFSAEMKVFSAEMKVFSTEIRIIFVVFFVFECNTKQVIILIDLVNIKEKCIFF